MKKAKSQAGISGTCVGLQKVHPGATGRQISALEKEDLSDYCSYQTKRWNISWVSEFRVTEGDRRIPG